MEDILHVLDLLRERAEAELAGLNTRRRVYLARISSIKYEVQGKSMPGLEGVDFTMFEIWRDHQFTQINVLYTRLHALEIDIVQAKERYKIILTKHISAQETVMRKALKACRDNEQAEADANLETYRQNTMRLV